MDDEIEFNSDDELLSAYLDGELSAESEAALAALAKLRVKEVEV